MSAARLKHFATAIGVALAPAYAPTASAAGFVFAGDEYGVTIVTHPKGYAGSGGNLVVTVGIDPTSVNAAQMVVPVQNVIRTVNALQPTTGNLQAANVPFSQWDFETVALHEFGHAMGLSHCNLATESGLSSSNHDYTKATDGNGNSNSNEPGAFDLDDGADNIKGSGDDLRGDDKNLNWYRKGVNDPGAALPAVVDSTTFGRLLADLPQGDTYVANGTQQVMNAKGHPSTESIMNQGTPNGRAQRTMTPEDVGALRMAMSGLDRLQGTADDYTFTVVYAGLTANADIVFDFDNSQTGFATTYTSGNFLTANHMALIGNPINIYFNTSAVAWFFNPVSNEPSEPEPGDPDNVFVDFGAAENGTGHPLYPFDNVVDAISFANDNASINLEPGNTSETFAAGNMIDKPLTLLNNNPGGGAVVIGN